MAKGTPLFNLRLPKRTIARLSSDAADLGISAAAYARSILVAHLSYTRQNKGVSHRDLHHDFSSADRAIKRFILASKFPISTAGSLPGKERRNSLEELSWEAVLEIIKFAKAQDDPELRLLAMRVASTIMRTELAVLHEQDQAAVDEFLDETEVDRSELAKKAQESARKKTSA